MKKQDKHLYPVQVLLIAAAVMLFILVAGEAQ